MVLTSLGPPGTAPLGRAPGRPPLADAAGGPTFVAAPGWLTFVGAPGLALLEAPAIAGISWGILGNPGRL